MKNKKLPTVTIAVSAYNEEGNIKEFLRSVTTQKEEGFKINAIWVHSDGSTDNTVKFAKSLKLKKVKIWDHKIRFGKSTLLNKIYRDLDTDILVQSDADVVLSHKLVLQDLIQPLINNKSVEMCGGNPQPKKAETFIEKAINCSVSAYSEFRKKVRTGNNVFSADGRLLAYRKEFVKNIVVPSDMIANDMFTYFCCISKGYEYRYVDSAVVLFRSPQTLQDQIKQNTRFIAGPIRMKNYFPKKLVDYELDIPKRMFVISLLKQFVRHPILSLSIFVINKYCKLRAKYIEQRLSAKWDMANTTKNLISI